MNINPYEPPTFASAAQVAPSPLRRTAIRDLRLTLIILLVPALYNLICFSYAITAGPLGWSPSVLYHIINCIGFVAIVLGVWRFGLAALEFAARVVHAVFGRRGQLSEWKAELYSTLHRAPPLAFGGAILWTIWVFAFYHLGINFYVVSWPIGILAHVLGACLYVPLIYRWYQLERTSSSPTSQ